MPLSSILRDGKLAQWGKVENTINDHSQKILGPKKKRFGVDLHFFLANPNFGKISVKKRHRDEPYSCSTLAQN